MILMAFVILQKHKSKNFVDFFLSAIIFVDMKLTKIVAGLLLAITIAIPCCIITGCGTLPQRPPQTVVLDSIQSTYELAREAYKTTVRSHLSGKVSDRDMADIDDAWNKFRAGTKLAVQSARTNWNSPAPEQLIQLKNDLFILIRSL